MESDVTSLEGSELKIQIVCHVACSCQGLGMSGATATAVCMDLCADIEFKRIVQSIVLGKPEDAGIRSDGS